MIRQRGVMKDNEIADELEDLSYRLDVARERLQRARDAAAKTVLRIKEATGE
jgi:hypothetical protein